MAMHMSNNVLEHVETGMDVYNRDGDKIGTVESIRFGDEDPSKPGPETATVSGTAYNNRDTNFVDLFAEAISPAPDIPDTLKARMLRQGFIRIDAGLLKSDRLAMAEQVERVTSEGVYLNISDHDELVKL